MEPMFNKIMKKQKEDIMFIEHQMKVLEALTQKRMEILRAIMEKRPSSIRELASQIDRDIKNVFDDLKVLHRVKIISLHREGRKVRPRIVKKFIVINLVGDEKWKKKTK